MVKLGRVDGKNTYTIITPTHDLCFFGKSSTYIGKKTEKAAAPIPKHSKSLFTIDFILSQEDRSM